MKVRLALDIGDFERFVIAKYYSGAASADRDKIRRRATRKQVTRFIHAMLRTSTRGLAANLPAKSRAAARKIETPLSGFSETLALPDDDQRSFPW